MVDGDDARAMRVATQAMTERLVADLADRAPAGQVMATIARCQVDLRRTGLDGLDLLEATDTAVRTWMTDQAQGRRHAPTTGAARFDAIEDELAARFPEAPPDIVHALVERARHSLVDARVQDFLPLLVRRIVSDRLTAHRRALSGL